MKKLLIIAAAIFSTNSVAQAIEFPAGFVPTCHMRYSVTSINAIVGGLGLGNAIVTCENIDGGEPTTDEVSIAVANIGAAGIVRESGDIYAMGVGLNTNKLLGLVGKVQAGLVVGNFGTRVAGGVMFSTDPSVKILVSYANDSFGLGAFYGTGIWLYSDLNGENAPILDDNYDEDGFFDGGQ